MDLVTILSVFLSLYPTIVCNFNHKLVKDVLNYRHLSSVLLLGCDEDLASTAQMLLRNGFYVQSKRLASRDPPHNDSLSAHSNQLAIVADISCSNFVQFLQQENSRHLFNSSFSWLLVNAFNQRYDDIKPLTDLCALRLDSDVLWARMATDKPGYRLMDIYANSNYQCDWLDERDIGEWNNATGLYIVPGYDRNTIRRTLSRHQLRVFMMDHDIQPQSMPGATKYHLALIKFLQDVHNFSVTFEKTGGSLKQIDTRYDLIGAGILQSLSQAPSMHMRIVHQSCSYDLSFIFRLTPELGGIFRVAGYLSPFTMEIWCVFGLLLALILVSLQLLMLCHDSLPRCTETTIHFLTDLIGMLAQQGTTTEGCSRVPVRIVLYTVLLTNAILYNFYIASIVGEMLSTTNMGPQSIEQLSRSPLLVLFHNDSYNRALAEDDDAMRSIKKLYNGEASRLAGASVISTNTIPIYTNVTTAVQLLQYESFAFHCELNEALGVIANRFDAEEICELRTMGGLFTSLRMMSFVLPKDSMYTEQFRTTLCKALETGQIRRLLSIHRQEMPSCQNGPLVQPAVMAGVAAPFYILAAGFVASLIILLLELLISCTSKSPLDGRTAKNVDE